MNMDEYDSVPSRDINGISKSNYDRAEQFAHKTAQQRSMISKWGRDDLEDKYLRLYEENLLLKRHARKQEDKIKRMATKLLRLVSDKKKLEQGQSPGPPPQGQGTAKNRIRDIEIEERLEELQDKIRELERQNNNLKEKLMVAKQQLAVSAKRTTPYPHVQARIDTGIPRPPPDPRIVRNLRVMGPPLSHHSGVPGVPGTPSQNVQQQRYGHSLLEEARDYNKQLESYIDQQQEQMNVQEQEMEMLREQLQMKEAEFEEDLLKIKQQMSQGQRVQIQENIDIIRLQREVKEKSTRMTLLEGQYAALEEKLRTVIERHDQVLHEMERVNQQVKEEQNKNLRLKNELQDTSSSQRRILELQERITDSERECEILKEANEKLVASAFDMEREREWRKKESALKIQIAQLEATLKADVGEKGSILDKLTEERDSHEKLQEEHSELRRKYYEVRHQYDDLEEKMKFFTKESEVDFQEIEEALVIVKQRKEKVSQELDFLIKVDEDKVKDYEKLVRELQAEHAETINELEKTRNMLIVQHKINKDYQMELDAVSHKMDEDKSEAETKLEEYARLLDIRAARIRKLESQMRDVAYGTRTYRPPVEDDEASEVDSVLDESINLEHGINIFEIHIKRVVLSQEGMRHLGDEEPSLFCTYEFFEFEIQATPVLKGPKAEFQFTSQYTVKVDDFLLHYLQKDSCTLELHQCVGTDYHTIAVCQLRLRDILDKGSGRLHGTSILTGVEEDGEGANFGTVEYWIRLRVPMAQALRLYKERTKALGYLDSNLRMADQALQVMDETVTQRPPDGVNELIFKIVKCQALISRRDGVQPSPYCVYKFFDFDDHDTDIVAGSNNPQFNYHKIFPVPVTLDLDKYLKSKMLSIYVFDDTDPETATYLGVAKIALLPLAHDKPIKGDFELFNPNGQVSGTIDVSLTWRYTYLPPRASTKTTAQQLLDSAVPSIAAEPPVELLPGEQEALQQRTVVSGAPGALDTSTPVPPGPRTHPGLRRGPTAASTPAKSLHYARDIPSPDVTAVQDEFTYQQEPVGAPRLALTASLEAEQDEDADSVVSEGSHVSGESEPVSVSEASTPRDRGPEPIGEMQDTLTAPTPVLESTQATEQAELSEDEELNAVFPSANQLSAPPVSANQFLATAGSANQLSVTASTNQLAVSRDSLASQLSAEIRDDSSEDEGPKDPQDEESGDEITEESDNETDDDEKDEATMGGFDEAPLSTLEEVKPVPFPRRSLSRQFSNSTESLRGTKGFLQRLKGTMATNTMTTDDQSTNDNTGFKSLDKKFKSRRQDKAKLINKPNKEVPNAEKNKKKKTQNDQTDKEDRDQKKTKSRFSLQGLFTRDKSNKLESKKVTKKSSEEENEDSSEKLEDTMFEDEGTPQQATAEEPHEDEEEGEETEDGDDDVEEVTDEEDSDGVVVASGRDRPPSSIATPGGLGFMDRRISEQFSNMRITKDRPLNCFTGGQPVKNADIVRVSINHLMFHEDSPVLLNDAIRMLYVEYRLLNIPLEQTETPFSLPKPTKPNAMVSFNFSRVFKVDFQENYEQRQFLASMLLPDDPDKGRIRFTLVSEPPPEQEDGDCNDIAFCHVSLPDILQSGQELIDHDVPLYLIEHEDTEVEVGIMNLTVECLAALKAVREEMATPGEDSQ